MSSIENCKCRLVDIVSYASDAGFYHLMPSAVVQLVNEDGIKALFKFAQKLLKRTEVK